jgi:hypothetical protein
MSMHVRGTEQDPVCHRVARNGSELFAQTAIHADLQDFQRPSANAPPCKPPTVVLARRAREVGIFGKGYVPE